MNVDPRSRETLNVLSIGAGGGGLDRAIGLAFPRARTVCVVEIEAFAGANLVAQMQAGVMADCPVWTNARTFRGNAWRGAVDIVAAGYPCQPFSLAGQRRGASDPRHLWPVVRRLFVQTGAWAVILENVSGHISLGAERVRRDLLRMGCAVEGGLFTAAEVGASQERERVFILGVADPQGAAGRSEQQSEGSRRGRSRSAGDGRQLADTHQPVLQGQPSAGQLGVDECDPSACLQSGAQHLADCDCDCDRTATDRRDDGQERDLSQTQGRTDDGSALLGRGSGSLAHASHASHASHAGPQGRGPDGNRPGERETAERGGGALGDTDGARTDIRFPPSRSRPAISQPGEELDGAMRGRYGLAESEIRPGRHGIVDAGYPAMVDAGRSERWSQSNGGHEPDREAPGWQESPGWPGQSGADGAVEWASHGPLFAPGPGDIEAWRWIAEHYPERLPAVSRHDLFVIALRKAGLGPDGRPLAGEGLEQEAPRAVRASVVQAIAQSTLRGRPDGLAPRIDQLRLLGNGVVDLEGAHAVRTLVTRLARRSPSAAELMGMMNE